MKLSMLSVAMPVSFGGWPGQGRSRLCQAVNNAASDEPNNPRGNASTIDVMSFILSPGMACYPLKSLVQT
jgi:hypothetical protein